MSYYDYQPPNKFGYKDTLPEGDAEKIIKGSEFDDEFKKISAESQAIDQVVQEYDERLDEEIENRIDGDQNLQDQIDGLVDGSINIEPDQIEGLPEYLDENYVNKVKTEDQEIVSKFTFTGPVEQGSGDILQGNAVPNKLVVDTENQKATFYSGLENSLIQDAGIPWDVTIQGSLTTQTTGFPASLMTYDGYGVSHNPDASITHREAGDPDNPINPDDSPERWIVKPNLDVEGNIYMDGTDLKQELEDIAGGIGSLAGQIVFGGTYSPNTGLIVKSNLSGFVDGDPLPDYSTVQGKFLICVEDGLNPVELKEGDWLVAGEAGWVPINYVSPPGAWEKNGDDIYYNDGFVGIGVDNPKTELNIAQTDNALSSGIRLTGVNKGGSWTIAKTDANGNNLEFASGASNNTNPADWGVRFTSSGQVWSKQQAHFREPDDYWATSGWYGIGNAGALASGGSGNMVLTYGGYRGPNDEWRSLAGLVGASQIQLNANNGNISFRGDADKADGSSYFPTARMTIFGSGEVGIGMNPVAATAAAQLANWKSELEAILEDRPDLEVKAAVRQATDDEFEVMPTEEAVAEWMETRAAGDRLQVDGPSFFQGRLRVVSGGVEAGSIYRHQAGAGGFIFDTAGFIKPCDNTGTATSGELNLGSDGARFKTLNVTNVNASGKVSAGPSEFGRPPNLWNTSGWYGVSDIGGLYTGGSYAVSLVSNGYRNTDGKWTSLGADGETGASEVRLLPDGRIVFMQDADKADGSSVNPTSRATFHADGGVDIDGSISASGTVTASNYFIPDGIAGAFGAPGSTRVQAFDTADKKLEFYGGRELVATFKDDGTATFKKSVSAGSFKKAGGTASQLLCADGSVVDKSSVGGGGSGGMEYDIDQPFSITTPEFYGAQPHSLVVNHGKTTAPTNPTVAVQISSKGGTGIQFNDLDASGITVNQISLGLTTVTVNGGSDPVFQVSGRKLSENNGGNVDFGGAYQYANYNYLRNMRITGSYSGTNVTFRDSAGVTARDLIDVFVALKNAVSNVNESDPVAAMSSMRSAITTTSDSLIQKFEAIHEAVADELEIRKIAMMKVPEGVDVTGAATQEVDL